MHASKQHLRLQWWPAAIVASSRRMPRDEQLVGAPLAQHIESEQRWRHHNRMWAIRPDGLHQMQTLDWPAIVLGKGEVAADVACRSSRLHAANQVPVRQG